MIFGSRLNTVPCQERPRAPTPTLTQQTLTFHPSPTNPRSTGQSSPFANRPYEVGIGPPLPPFVAGVVASLLHLRGGGARIYGEQFPLP